MTTDPSSTTTQTSPPPPAPPPQSSYPPLAAMRRSRSDRKLVGVAGGLGRYAGVDPLIFRILFVVLTFFGGTGILLYALGWLLIPDEGQAESEAQRLLNGRRTGGTVQTVVAGVVVLVLGLVVVATLLDTGPGLGGMAAFIAVAALIVLVARSDRRPVPTMATGDPVAAGPAGFPAEQDVTSPQLPPPGAYGQTTGTAYATPPAPDQGAPPPPPGYPAPPGYAAFQPPPAPPRERSMLGRLTVSVALIVVGVLIGWNAATTSDVPAVVILAAALLVVGLGLTVGAVFGRSRWLIVLGIVLSVATAIAGAAQGSARGGFGERTWIPRTVADAEVEHRLGIGDATLDLTEVPLDGSTVEVDLRVGVGSVTVLVPDDVRVAVDAQVGAGELRVFDLEPIDGTDLTVITTDEDTGIFDSTAEITIDAELGLGDLEVLRATP